MKKQYLATVTLADGTCLNAGMVFGSSRYFSTVESAKDAIDRVVKLYAKSKKVVRAGYLAVETNDPDLTVVSWSIKVREVTPWDEVSSKTL